MAVRFVALEHVLGRGSELAAPGFEADAAGNIELLREHLRVLIVGAGGLGCEMLKVRCMGDESVCLWSGDWLIELIRGLGEKMTSDLEGKLKEREM